MMAMMLMMMMMMTMTMVTMMMTILNTKYGFPKCGCQCRHITASQCVGKFNEVTVVIIITNNIIIIIIIMKKVNCECECDEATFGEERKRFSHR